MKLSNDKNSKFYKFMKKYYEFKPMRAFVTFSIFVCEISLILYMMVLPIQLAYHYELSSSENVEVQNIIDVLVCAFFTYHIFLYFDSNMEKIIKSPNALPKYKIEKLGKWSRLVNLELGYDIITWAVSIFMASPEQNSFSERIIELVFFLKVYKIYKFHKKTTYLVIGTSFYSIYKIFFTILVTFTVISYLSSIFYAIDYAIYTNGGPISGDIWLVGMGTEPNLVDKSFWVQLLIINYWAMGTSSTAAYGDICGEAPEEVIYNVFILYFANFLYGWYLNNIQIIPKEIKERERKILEQFAHFKNYNRIGKEHKKESSKKMFSDEIYLKILCSIEYNETEKSTRKVIDEAVPQKYLEQIKFEIYTEFFVCEQIKMYQSRGFFNNEDTLLKVAKIINEKVFEKDENVYDYESISSTDLFYINEGQIELTLPGELENILSLTKNKTEMFGQYAFITNQNIKMNAICSEYVSAYIIKREDYKRSLIFEELKYFNSMFMKCFEFKEERIQEEPFRFFNDIIEKKDSPLIFNRPSTRSKKCEKILKSKEQQRIEIDREKLISKKVFISEKMRKTKTIGIQTDKEEFNQWKNEFESVVSL